MIERYADSEALALAAAKHFVRAAESAIACRGRFRWAAAGGSTPRRCYEILAGADFRDRLDWALVESWLGDERLVPTTHEASNARMLSETLLDPLGSLAGPFHAYDTSLEPSQIVAQAEQTVRQRLPSTLAGARRLDFVLLGIGSDCHTASWFPGSTFDVARLVEVTDEERVGYRRITMTPTLINAAREVAFLVSGSGKAEALARIVGSKRDPLMWPAQRVKLDSGTLRWCVDQSAAALLPRDAFFNV